MTESEAVELDERIGKLEETVARGFYGDGQRFGGLEGRMTNLEARMDAIKTVLERIDGLSQQMERSTKAIRRRHTADRRLTRLILADHNGRLRHLERAGHRRAAPQTARA